MEEKNPYEDIIHVGIKGRHGVFTSPFSSRA